MTDRQRLKGNLDLLLLCAVARGEAHGYALIERLRDLSAGTFDLPEGTVYPALHELEADGLLASRWTEASGRRRKLYHLTGKGRRSMADERQAWNSFAAAVQAVAGGV